MEEEEEVEKRAWDELIPDTLGLIFRKLPLDDILNLVPRVCKSWDKTVKGSYIWQQIDIEDWSRYRRSDTVDRMLHLLILRSSGSVTKLSVFGLSTPSTFFFIADHAKYLTNLRLPRSEISDSVVEQVAGRLSNLTSLDLSYCTKIGAPALEVLGKNCKFLACLLRNMHPWDVIERTSQDDEASAIVAAIPKLKHLELAYLMITTESVKRIINNCHELEFLDIRGCWNVKLDDKFVKKFSNLNVVGPLVVDWCGESSGWDEHYDHYPGSSSFWTCDFSADDDDDFGSFGDGEWDEIHDMGDLGLMSYDDCTDVYRGWSSP